MKSDEDKILTIYKDLHELVQADIHYHHEIYSKSASIVESLYDKVERNSDKFEEQYDLLQQEIKNIIKDKIISYNKEVLIIFLLTIKELATYATIISPEAINWSVVSKIERSLILLSFVLFIPKEEFKNRNILNRKDKISVIEALALAGRIELLTENVQKVLNGHIVKSLKDCIAFFIEDEKDSNYYEEYIRMGKNEKPEDIHFTNPTINKYIEHEGMSISKIYTLINEDFKSEIGFSINDLDEFGSFIYQFYLVQKDVYILIHKYDFFLNLFIEQTKLCKNTFDNDRL